MNTESIKLNLIEWIMKQDITMLKKIDLLRKNQEVRISPLTIKELEQRAISSEEDIKSGRLTSLEKLTEEVKSW